MDTQNPSENKHSDKKVLALIFLASFSILVLLSGVSVFGYYYFKNTKLFKEVNWSKTVSDLESGFSEIPPTPTGIPTPTPAQPQATPTVSPTSKSTSTSQKYPIRAEVPAQTCYKYTIYEGEFKSSKCYTSDDYSALAYYTSKYSSAKFSKESAEDTIKFTCDDDYFKDSCDAAKKRKKQAESDLAKYTTEINAIISRGW
jgi:hypothetical protein